MIERAVQNVVSICIMVSFHSHVFMYRLTIVRSFHGIESIFAAGMYGEAHIHSVRLAECTRTTSIRVYFVISPGRQGS